MSGKKQTEAARHDVGQRTDYTRKALLDSLSKLVHERRYDEIAVGDIALDANVGRSTFYDHYRGKDDMIVETMGGMLDVMADLAAEQEAVLALEQVLRHFQENRTFARHLFTSAAGRDVSIRIARELAKRIESRLETRVRGRDVQPVIPLPLVATQVAESQFALVRAWLSGDQGCTPAQLARGMRLSAVGAIAALLRPVRIEP